MKAGIAKKQNLYAQKLAASKAKKLAKKVAAKKAESSPEATFQKLDLAEDVEKLKAKTRFWLCSAGHSLDSKEQECDLCLNELLREKCAHGVCFRIESCDACDRTVKLTAAEATSVEEALRNLRQVLELLKAPLLGLGGLPPDSPAAEVIQRGREAEALLRQALTPRRHSQS